MPNAKLIPAAAYIRMSGRQQDKSPAEQRAEITKLASREGFSIVEFFTDEAITGDSSTDARPGLAALLAGAKVGKFKVVLAWHTNRVSREDPMDAIVFYNQLRKAGVGLHTCCEGAIDLASFTGQLVLFVQQKGSNDFRPKCRPRRCGGESPTPRPAATTAGRQSTQWTGACLIRPASWCVDYRRGSTFGKQGTGFIYSLAPIKARSTRYATPLSDTTRRTSAFGTWHGNWKPRVFQAREARVGPTTTLPTCSHAGLRGDGPMGRKGDGQVPHRPRG